jgi:hypothetical protein
MPRKAVFLQVSPGVRFPLAPQSLWSSGRWLPVRLFEAVRSVVNSRVETVGHFVQVFVEEVRVRVESHCRLGVPEDPLNSLHVCVGTACGLAAHGVGRVGLASLLSRTRLRSWRS